MTWDDVKVWLYHLFHDPMRDNPWSLAALVVIVAALLGGMLLLGVAVNRGRQMIFRRRNREDETVSEPRDTSQDARRLADDSISRAMVPPAQDTDEAMPSTSIPTMLNIPDGQRWAELGTTTDGGKVYFRPDPVADSGVHALPDTTEGHRVACTHCEGAGYVIRTTSELLRESIGLVGDGGDMVVREFYTRLFAVAPDLAALFPPDLLTTDETKRQRDRLLKAIIALSQSYNTDDPAGMDRLDTALAAFGRSHSKFRYPDGSERGATLEQYAVVKAVLFEVLVAVAGDKWVPAYTEAWSEAYDYAAGVMLAEARRGGQQFARMPRA